MASVTLSWAANPAADNVTSYKIYGANGTGTVFGSTALLATVSALTWTDTGLPYSQARTYYIAAHNTVGDSSPEGPINVSTPAASGTYLQVANNLSDVANAATSRSNLGLGTAATHAATDFLLAASNLSDLANVATARSNLGLGTAATHAATDFLLAASNLSDLANAATARSNLGLGSLAVLSTINGSLWSGADLAVADGGTGASSASAARNNLGLAIGTDVQAWDADLDALAALSGTNTIYYRSAANTWTAVTFSGLTFSAGVLSVDATTVKPTESLVVAVGDETTAITTGTSKITFRMPYAFTLSDIRGSLTTAQTSGSIFTVDVNESGTSVISTKLTIDNTETTSTTAATPPVISDSSLADDAQITIDVDQIGDGTAKGLKVTLIGSRI